MAPTAVETNNGRLSRFPVPVAVLVPPNLRQLELLNMKARRNMEVYTFWLVPRIANERNKLAALKTFEACFALAVFEATHLWLQCRVDRPVEQLLLDRQTPFPLTDVVAQKAAEL